MKLVKLTKDYKDQLIEMIDEWKKDIEENNTNHSPSQIFKNDCHDFDNYINNLERKEEINGIVPNSVYFLLDEKNNEFVGACDIRHYLNEGLKICGGHIGDGVRPSRRKQGNGTLLVKLALEKCKEMGINKVLMTCDKTNIASAKTITKNGGVLENEVLLPDGITEQRYWITL